MTAFYTGRAFFMTFFGPEKLPDPSLVEAHHGTDQPEGAHHSGADAHGHAADPGHDSHFGHESPPVMTIPLMILAVCALLAGLVFGPTGLFEHHLEQTHGLEVTEHAVKHSFDWTTAIIGTLAGLGGLALSYAFYYKPSPIPARLATRLRPLYLASLYKFDVDEIYTWIIIWPTRFLALTADFLDKFLIDGLVQGVAKGWWSSALTIVGNSVVPSMPVSTLGETRTWTSVAWAMLAKKRNASDARYKEGRSMQMRVLRGEEMRQC